MWVAGAGATWRPRVGHGDVRVRSQAISPLPMLMPMHATPSAHACTNGASGTRPYIQDASTNIKDTQEHCAPLPRRRSLSVHTLACSTSPLCLYTYLHMLHIPSLSIHTLAYAPHPLFVCTHTCICSTSPLCLYTHLHMLYIPSLCAERRRLRVSSSN